MGEGEGDGESGVRVQEWVAGLAGGQARAMTGDEMMMMMILPGLMNAMMMDAMTMMMTVDDR